MSATATKPKRIQRKRTRGWKMPPNCVYVGRPGRFGNPYIVAKVPGGFTVILYGHPAWAEEHNGLLKPHTADRRIAAAKAVELYRESISEPAKEYLRQRIGYELRGKDLCCWCALDCECHADTLLEIANK